MTSLTGATASIANTETNIVTLTIPANTLTVGSSFRIVAYGTRSGSNTTAPVFNARIGTTTAANAGNIAVAPSIAGTATASNVVLDTTVTVRSTGASGTIGGASLATYGVTITNTINTTPVTVDTTAINYLKFTCASGQATNSYIFYYAVIYEVA